MRRSARSGARGSTLVEVMIATVVLILAGTGFAGTSMIAAGSTRIGHRRTAATFLRAGLVDRVQVMPRSVLRGIAASAEDTWIVDSCYDVAAQSLPPGTRNTAYSTTYTCPAGTYYRSWIKVTDNDAGAGAWAPTTNAWTVGLYVERVDPGCTAAQRDGSVACVSADLLLTD